MAALALHVSVPQSQPIIRFPSFSLSRFSQCSKRRNLLYCAPPHLDNVRSEVSLCVGTHLIPHPNKALTGGEDAFFVSSYSGGVIAVADGVSGWAKENVDPALFPREFLANASDLVGNDDEVNNDPQILLRKAHASTSATGSATVIVAMMERNGKLKIANVGDCGLKVIRKGQIIFSTSPQEHYFDCPYQLSSERVGQTFLDAKVSNVELMEGDILVMGSDGLFDNVFDHEIVAIATKYVDVGEAAKALANLANSHSADKTFESPYSLEARSKGYDVPFWKKILGMKLTGGKLDDITVVVGQVVSS
ncbi:probable protein phosphatase 2C 26 [Cucurbita moschata]|uniref:Protein phosphatase n=1 Tax=Cucurbita moschata TaxID=3662 RepID=A0A6J1G8Y1_CUCMO|nr:probable protein phosphatase 2C 26 [Cucurbita moschata]XP_022948287.1 probable protein phosphatase 2C 26 [Cucurbita moschata]XP_022948288.1 probable protein phosphatase 2C 26 [Cucurbita moschata]